MRQTAALNWWQAPGVEATATGTAVTGRLAFAALVLFTVVLVAAPQEFVTTLQPFRLGLVAGGTALAACLIGRWRLGMAAPPWPREVVILMLLVGWAVLMVPLSYWPGGSIALLIDLYSKSVAIFLLLAGLVNTPRRLRQIVWVLVLCTLPISLTALYHYRAGVFLPGAPGRIAGYGLTGLAGNPNDLALLLNLVIPFTAALAVVSRTIVARMAAAGMLGLAMVGIVVTFSRGGFLTLAVIVLMYLGRFVRRRKLGALVIVPLLVVAALPWAPTGYLERLGTVTAIESDPTGSAQDRWRDIVAASTFAVAHPILGAGPGQDVLALNDVRGAAWIPVHNVYLNYAVDLGLPGLLLFLVLGLSCLQGVARVERARAGCDPRDDVRQFAGAARVSLIAFFAAAFVYPVAYQAFFFYIGGLAVAIRLIAQSPAGIDPTVAADSRQAA